MTSIWRVLYYHNAGHWRSNILLICNSGFSVAILLLITQLSLGIEHFYAVVNNVIGHAKIIHVTVDGNYVIVPSNSTYSWSLWNPGKQLVIGSDSVDLLGTIQRILFLVFGSLGSAMLAKEVLASRQVSKMEMESRSADYKVLLDVTLDRRFIVKLASYQKLVFTLCAFALGLTVSEFGLMPIIKLGLDRAVPGISTFFTLAPMDLAILSGPLLLLSLAGAVFTRFYAQKLLKRLI